MRRPWTFILLHEDFSRLSIAPIVDDKQHLNDLVFSALVRFWLLEKYPTSEQKKRYTWNAGSLITLKVWFFPKKIWIKCEECAGALSWWSCQLPVDHKSGLLRRTASRRRRRTSLYYPLVIIRSCGAYSWCTMKIRR
jgi:hypothetical protein